MGNSGGLRANKQASTITGTLLLVFPLSFAACGGPDAEHPSDAADDSGDTATTPTIVSTEPVDGTMGVPINGTVGVTFSGEMDATTLTANTFTLTVGPGSMPVDGTVIYANATAVFLPAGNLERDSAYTATITTGVRSISGGSLAEPHSWRFITGSTVAGIPVNLRTAGNYAVLSRRAISGTGAMVTGDVGISPSMSNSITGFALSTPPTTFATSSQVIGKVYARDFLAPTPATLVTAVQDLQLAVTEAATRTPTVTGAGGEIGGMTLAPGIYHWDLVAITTDVTLSGSATDVWIFQVAGTLGMAAAMKVVLVGGAQPENVFWQVTGAMTIGANAQFNGVVLTSGAFTSGAGSLITGRLLSQMEITITNSVVVQSPP